MLMQFVVLPRRVQSGRDSREMDVNLPVCIIDGAATLEDWRRLGLLRRDRGVSPPARGAFGEPAPAPQVPVQLHGRALPAAQRPRDHALRDRRGRGLLDGAAASVA